VWIEGIEDPELYTWDEYGEWPGVVLTMDTPSAFGTVTGRASSTEPNFEEIDHDFEEQLEIDIDDEVLIFTHDATGRQFSAPQLVSGVQELGQRGFARKFNIPRTTVQEWLKRAEASGY
jgi:hypothetical protein